MSVCIRLRKTGKNPKKRYFFRISVFDKRKARDSRSIEELGYYDPTKEPPIIKINTERLNYWLSRGAQMSDTVSGLVKRSHDLASDSEAKSSG
jgi:small subunit ribosomal protein S16